MRGSPFAVVAGFVVLFGLSTGAGYSVGAAVNGTPEEVAGPAAPGASTALPATTLVTTTTSTEPTTTTTEVTTTTTEAGPRRPTADDPLRVVLAGDSVMAGLAPAVKAALEADGTTQVRFVLTPSILRDPTVRFTWNQELSGFDPEVIVMFVGTWESEVLRTGSGAASDDPAWRAEYEANVLDPWLQLITSQGASVIWIGNATVANPEATAAFTALNEAYAELPSRWPGVTFLPAEEALNGTEPGYHDVIARPADGVWIRTRQLDGLHLCADGAEQLAERVVAELTTTWKAREAPGWPSGAWRQAPEYPPASCPEPQLP